MLYFSLAVSIISSRVDTDKEGWVEPDSDETSNHEGIPWIRRSSRDNLGRLYFICKSVGNHCDFRRNMRVMVDFETDWAYRFLKQLRWSDVAEFFGVFDKLHTRIAHNNQARKASCPNVLHPGGFILRAKSIDLGDNLNFGTVMANYVNAPAVNFKAANDAITDSSLPGRDPACSWELGEPGWGDHYEELRRKMRGPETKFMWSMEKGRGTAEDKIAMVYEIPKENTTNGLVTKFNKIYDANAARGKKHPHYYYKMSANQQSRLSGIVRWAQTRRNKYFGLHAFGDSREFHGGSSRSEYFFEEVIKGGGIHGRSLEPSNPADRMMWYGMPWIGGVSGSIVDFYITARALGYKGHVLAKLVLIDMACLIAGGQHSLGELMFGAAEAELVDSMGMKDTGFNSSFDREAAGEDDGFPPNTEDTMPRYFATPQFQAIMKELNDIRDWGQVRRSGEESFVSYTTALNELARRSMMDWRHSWGPGENDEKEEEEPEEGTHLMSKCIEQNALAAQDFRVAVYWAGYWTAWRHWSADGIDGFGGADMSPGEFIMNIASKLRPRWIIMSNIAWDTMRLLHAGVSPTENTQFTMAWLRERESNIANLFKCIDTPVMHTRFNFSVVGGISKKEFNTLYELVANTRDCVADDVEVGAWARTRGWIPEDFRLIS